MPASKFATEQATATTKPVVAARPGQITKVRSPLETPVKPATKKIEHEKPATDKEPEWPKEPSDLEEDYEKKYDDYIDALKAHIAKWYKPQPADLSETDISDPEQLDHMLSVIAREYLSFWMRERDLEYEFDSEELCEPDEDYQLWELKSIKYPESVAEASGSFFDKCFERIKEKLASIQCDDEEHIDIWA